MMDHNPQSGNVLFYILIAVALLAALSFAVSNSGQGRNDMISEERARLVAAEILEYADIVSTAVSQTKLRGYSDTEISFENSKIAGYTNANCTDDICKIFSLSGGAINYAVPNSLTTNASNPEWIFSANQDIFGTNTTDGDLAIYLNNIRPEICKQINGLLNITTISDYPEDASTLVLNKFTGSFASNDAPNDEDTSIESQNTGCVNLTASNTYLFYKVLISR
ncbi:MAG: hypothetical protein GW778_00505 [Alphaproteobacteria bacterium]|nr:hypothetical protein [Alphaproteobacteria bacterium]